MQNYRRLLAALKPHLGLLVFAIASMIFLSAATGLFTWLVGPMFQFVFKGGDLGAEAVHTALPWLHLNPDKETIQRALPVLILLIAVVRGAAYFGQFFTMGMLGQRIVADLRLALHKKLLELPPSFFARAASGDLLSRFANDVAAVEFAVTYGLASYLRDGMMVLVQLGVCVWLDWRLALLAFVAVPLTVVPIVRFAKRLKRIATRGQEQIGNLYTLLHEALQGVRIVQAFGMEEYEREKFSAEQERFLATMRKSFFVRAIFTPTLELMAAVGIAATVVFAARAVASHELQPERVISFLAAIVLLYTPLKSLGGTGQGVTQGMAGAVRLFEVLDEPATPISGPLELPRFSSEVRFEHVSYRYPAREGLALLEAPLVLDDVTTPISGPLELPRFSSEVRFEHVSYRYPAREGLALLEAPLVLDDVSLSLRRGEVVALVGPSGGGKTTLLNLIARFADPSAGQVLIDGRDLREVSLRSLRAQVALVAQETFLFNDSIKANIAYGRPDVDQARLAAAAQAARADGFIAALPQAMETEVGERGTTLSGGQRQRIAIARALLKDAPILLLDEATSALDTESEREVQRALDRLMKDRTCLVIAHRLSTIRHADRIAVLVAGRLAELGTHDELIARGGEYARLYALQFAPLADAG